MSDVLVVHDLGTAGGAPWSDAFRRVGLEVDAPDLPGHGDAPPAVGGHHELGDIVFDLLDHLDDAARPCVVGVGRSGNAARLLALGGRASALVLVDGLGGPWLDISERNRVLRDLRRQILAMPAALAPPAAGTVDVRADLVLGQSDRPHVVRSLAAVPVPTLVVETPASPTPDADEVAGVIPDHELVRVDDQGLETVAAVVDRWLTTRSSPRSG